MTSSIDTSRARCSPLRSTPFAAFKHMLSRTARLIAPQSGGARGCLFRSSCMIVRSVLLLACIGLATYLPAQSYDFTTLAGSPGSFGTVDGTGSVARFNGPLGLSVDSGGNVYVTNRESHVI